jgi:methionyl aminopeptidase
MSRIPLKTGKQIDAMRESCQAASRILARLAAMVEPGVSTGQLDAAAADFIAEEGCTSAFFGYKGFPGQICVSINEEVVHGIGGPRRINYGDIVKLDVGVVRKGWVGDNAVTVAAGAIAF